MFLEEVTDQEILEIQEFIDIHEEKAVEEIAVEELQESASLPVSESMNERLHWDI